MESTAELVADLFGNDGLSFECAEGELTEVCLRYGATIEYGERRWDDIEEDYYVERVSLSQGLTTDTLVRYLFADGSAIDASFSAWDIEGEEPFSWAGA
jgi:hypothetical protein